MKAVIQIVSESSVSIEGSIHGSIKEGMLILLGIDQEDQVDDIDWLTRKIIGMRIFSDTAGKMNLSIYDIKGSFLVISQFTLQASTKKGNRPSFIKAAKPNVAVQLYRQFCDKLKIESNLPVKTGVFGANMKVSLVNEGPVTIILDSKNKV